MRSPSIEYLHSKIEKQILLTEKYTEIKGLDFIIKACRLKPYDYLFKKRDDKIILYRSWFDEFGNSLIISKKKINIVLNDLSLDRESITSTDLYYNLSINNVAKMSKFVHLVAGKDEDLYLDCYLLTFLGIDDHFRSYLYWYGEWQQVSPLLMGIKSLKLLVKNLDNKNYRKLRKKENLILPCINGEAWLSCEPHHADFLDLLKSRHEIIYKILKKENNG